MVLQNISSAEESTGLLSTDNQVTEESNAVSVHHSSEQHVSTTHSTSEEKSEANGQHVVLDIEPLVLSQGSIQAEQDSLATGGESALAERLTGLEKLDSSVSLPHVAPTISIGSDVDESNKQADTSTLRPDSFGSPGCSSPRLDDGRGECRICQEEDDVANLETPCACSGSVKFAHRKCVQRWCNEKGNTTCEICHEVYKNGYTAPVRRQLLTPEELPAHIRDEIALPLNHRGFLRRDSRIYAVTVGDRQFLEVEYEDDISATHTGATWCRSAALMLLALLLLRHAFVVAGTGDDEDPGMFTLFVLRVIGILLPCYVMARALNLMQRRQEEEASLMAQTEGRGSVAFLLQSQRGQSSNGMNVLAVPPLVQNQA